MQRIIQTKLIPLLIALVTISGCATERILRDMPRDRWQSQRVEIPKRIEDKSGEAYLKGYEYIGWINYIGSEEKALREAGKRGAELVYIKKEKRQVEFMGYEEAYKTTDYSRGMDIQGRKVLYEKTTTYYRPRSQWKEKEVTTLDLFRNNSNIKRAVRRGIADYGIEGAYKWNPPVYLKRYLEHGLDPDTQDNSCKTPLYNILQQYLDYGDYDNYDETVEAITLLLDAGANPNAVPEPKYPKPLRLIDEQVNKDNSNISEYKAKCAKDASSFYCKWIDKGKRKLASYEYLKKILIKAGATTEGDDFIFCGKFRDNRDGWIELDKPTIETKVDRLAYNIDYRRQGGRWVSWKNININEDNNFIIEVAMTKSSGPEGMGYGIVWGLKDINNYYAFLVSGDGKYVYLKLEKNKYNYIIPWTKSDIVGSGNSDNNIVIRKKGGTLFFFLNDFFVAKAPFETFFGQNVGFHVGGGMAIKVWELIIRGTPKKSEVG